ncbi:hypothetical protein LJ707_17070 [Mucilaginibacter sp. UR6-1]|uniref:hypothetical protein n=1 Tax=Mucilaginibacter sp. UR6-1 TaxID=1435643 RepID=UPI001E5D6458|nr:hypothetical protein [Mucilaginibacter sp. UR6-1]MCC8410657.1 hypothetical protein [Mucilaginibacter sp. UR6-1]
MKANFTGIKSGFIRLVVYGALIFGAAEFIRWDATLVHGQESKFDEDSMTELMQSALLLVAASVYMIVFIRFKQFKALAFFLFSFVTASFIREQDSFLDEHIFDGAWQVGVFSLFAFMVLYLWRNGRQFLQNINAFVNTPAFGVFITGFLTTYVFSRLYGRGKFWQEIMEDRYFRAVKNASEECTELFGYTILLIAAVEFLLFVKRDSMKAITANQTVLPQKSPKMHAV